MSVRLLTEVDRLDRLLKDLRRLQEYDIRAIDLSADAPLLMDYVATTRRIPCLEGTVYGHPILPDGRPIFTSELHAYLEDDGQLYARTLNRWYRLEVSGKPGQNA